MRFHTYIVSLATVLALAACGRVETSDSGIQASPPLQITSVPLTSAPATTVPQLPSSTATAAMRSTATATVQPTPEATAVAQQTGEAMSTTEIVPQISPRPAIDTIVIYRKSGGLAGISETMTVYSDGRVELIKRGEQTSQIQIQPAELAALKRLLSTSEFAAVQSPTMPPAADAFIYEVTVPSPGGKDHTVKTSDATQNPAALDKVLDELGQLRKQIQG